MIAYQVINAQLFQLQHNRAQVGPQDLWVGLLLKVLLERGFSIQPETLARLCTTGTPSSLVGTGLHDNVCLVDAATLHLSSVQDSSEQHMSEGRCHEGNLH